MRLARVGPPGAEIPVLAGRGGELLDLRPLTPDIDAGFLSEGLARAEAAAAEGRLPALEREPVRWGSPVARPGKVVGVGLNYAGHAAEAGAPVPSEPVLFLKASTSVCGPCDDIRTLPGSRHTDYEVELGVVLGSVLRDEQVPGRALAAVAGYVLAQDVSDRAMQLERGGTWTKGKSADTFCPLGPWLVTPDELGDTAAVRLTLRVNEHTRQDALTDDMIFPVGQVLCYTSGLMTLEPGDVVITGTPAGVAVGQPEPRPYLRHGDLVTADGGALGRQRNHVVDPSAVGDLGAVPRRASGGIRS